MRRKNRKVSKQMNVNSPEGQRVISDLIIAWLKEGKNGCRYAQLFGEFVEIGRDRRPMVKEDVVADVQWVIQVYGEFYKILDWKERIIDPDRFGKWIGYWVDIQAIMIKDPVALAWVRSQCHSVAESVRRIYKIQLGSDALDRIVQDAFQMVCEIVEGDIEDTHAPIPPEDLIEYAVYDTVSKYLSEQNIVVPGISQRYEERDQQYKQITIKVGPVLMRIQGSLSYLLGENLAEKICDCLKDAFLQLLDPPSGLRPAPRRVRLIALAYDENGKRRNSEEIAQDLVTLGPDRRTNSRSVDVNLSQDALPALRRNAKAQFLAAISRLLASPGGTEEAERVLLSLCREYLKECIHDSESRDWFLTELKQLQSGSLDIDRSARAFCEEYLPLGTLHEEDTNFIANVVRLFLTVRLRDNHTMDRICEEVCRQGIPDRREKLYALGMVKMCKALSQGQVS